MSLQQTALQNPADAGEEWVLEEQAPNTQQQTLTTSPNDPAPGDPAANQEEAAPPFNDLDRVALELGWTPKEEWRGDPDKWTSSAEYLRATGRLLERTKNDLKLTRRQTDELNARLARVELGQQSLTQQRAQELHMQYEDAKLAAAKAGDDAAYHKLAQEQQEVLAKFQQSESPAAPPLEADVYAKAEQIMSDPLAARFFEANPVALHDERAWVLMNSEMTRMARAGGGAAAQFKAAEEALRYVYAQAYERPGTNGQQGIPQQRGQEQPRAPDGRFVAQQQQQQQRRPAPPIAAATRTNAAQPASAVDRLDGDARAFLQTQITQGAVKDAERWARVYLGEKLSPITPIGARS